MSPTIQLCFPDPSIPSITLNTGLFINGQFVESVNKKRLQTVNPATGKIIGEVVQGDHEDVELAVLAAEEAFKTVWGLKYQGRDRGKLLNKLAEAIEEHATSFSAIEALDNGKPLSVAQAFDITEAAASLRYYAGWADKHHGKVIEVNEGLLAYTRHEPIGVVAQIIPWNFPLLMFAWKIAPALATGNTIVIKPAEQTPLSALYLCHFIKEIFPPGVVNVINGLGPEVGAALSSHMRIHKLAFTGSTAVGRTILKAASLSNLKRVTLELGGKSPNIILEDADLEQAVKWAGFAVLFNQGQTCCAGSRVFVEDSIYEKFIDELQVYFKSQKIGSPFDSETCHGPQISKLQFDRIFDYIQTAKKEGATTLIGGKQHGTEGFFIEPTIFTDVKPEMKIVKEEIFGPVLAVSRFKDEDDLIHQANDSIYGLAAAVHGKDISRAIKIGHKLQAGTVWINCYNKIYPNCPFGGYKQSGIGRELGEDALENYTNLKTMQVNLSERI